MSGVTRMGQPLMIGEDRGMAVPPGSIVQTGYVRIEMVRLACRDRMAIGDVERAMQRRMSCAPSQPWPCPRGHWQGERFVVIDGRHEYVAALMLGVECILVAWVDDGTATHAAERSGTTQARRG